MADNLYRRLLAVLWHPETSFWYPRDILCIFFSQKKPCWCCCLFMVTVSLWECFWFLGIIYLHIVISAHADVCIIMHPHFILWMPSGRPQDALWMPSGRPQDTLRTSSGRPQDTLRLPSGNHLDIIWTFSGHSWKSSLIFIQTGYQPDILPTSSRNSFIKKAMQMLFLFFYCVNVPGFLVSCICTTAP